MIHNGYYSVVLLLTTITAYCACASLGLSSSAPGKFGSGIGLSPAQFQTWQEWIKKRSFGTTSKAAPWGGRASPFTANHFQDWREYMNKRGFHIPDSPESHQQFQSWLDWSKRTQQHDDAALGVNDEENPFPNTQNFGKFQAFQNWNDWYSKRSAGAASPFGGHGSAAFGSFGGSPGGSMQSWEEFMKRNGLEFGDHGAGLDFPQTVGLQNWNEWVKRFGPSTSSGGQWGGFGPGGFGWNNKQQFTDWQSHYKHAAKKRQLGSRPRSFGSFQNYFTNGLQDWRSTFKGTKRGSDNDGSNPEQNASVVAPKEQDQ
ncbi:hypothetical protein ElyMa_001382900 [Elysia marginata]|uniref:Uncharacterized protein n=1 Tax=Elysia marginata TaxID=1093978 RepID=A0AAV4IRQ8_9GAST|nr:hypothetical protein ElyMa_001382900 [Elysia marginata]